MPRPAVRPIPLEQTRALRQAVLRPHQTVEELATHEPAGAIAFGAFDGDELVGVGLVGPEGDPGAWRIRGMATAPEARGRGTGTAVLDALVRHASAQGAASVWCNARVRAIPLYERAGLRVVSDVFEPPDIGPHVRMELPVFLGFGPDVFAWFAGLERDNSKLYFTATRDLYERGVRGGLEAMLDELTMGFGGQARVFRQQRDLRFTPDKTPYKTRTYGVIGGASVPGAGLYAQLSASGLYAGTGYWRLARDQLERFRAAVVDDAAGPRLEDVTAAAQEAGLELAGQSLRTAPRGHAREHPRIELLRRKALIAGRALSGEAGIGRDAALDHVAGAWRAAEPLNAWLDEHVGPSTLPREQRGGRR
ncbi:MAG: GNAT family N-acetyltransferase [Solirubrobacteraceae bacterium]